MLCAARNRSDLQIVYKWIVAGPLFTHQKAEARELDLCNGGNKAILHWFQGQFVIHRIQFDS